MPLVGESATLYFQDEIDSSPIVTSCVRKNGSTCEAMSDTANRYFATESGNYLDMLPGAINFHRSGLNVSFNDDNGIDFSSSGNLSVGASGGVSLSAGSVSISATSKLLVQKGKSSYVSLENEFYANASVVYESGSSRQSYAAFTDDEPTAGAAEALAKQKAALAKKNAERLKFNNGNLFLGMSGARATSGQVPTLNGSIMGSAGKNPGESYIGPATKGAIPVYEQDWEIDARNFRNAPGEYKLGFLTEYFYDRTFGYASQVFTFFGLCDGMQPQYAQVYGDMMSGMVFESVATVATSGLKSASGLNKGFVSGDDIIAENGFGNTAKTSYVKSSEISEVVSNPNVVKKVNKKGNTTIDYTNNSGNTLRTVEQRPKDIEKSIATKLVSDDVGDQVEGKVGKFINENTSSEITSFAQKVEKLRPKGPEVGDIDVATKNEQIEVKKSINSVDKEQLQKYTDINHKNYFNHEGKKIILYIDEPLNENNIDQVKWIESMGIKVVNSLEELKGVLS